MKKIIFLSVGLLFCLLQTAWSQNQKPDLHKPFTYGDALAGCYKDGDATCWHEIKYIYKPEACDGEKFPRNLISTHMANRCLELTGLTPHQRKNAANVIYTQEDDKVNAPIDNKKFLRYETREGHIDTIFPPRYTLVEAQELGGLIWYLYGCTDGLVKNLVEICEGTPRESRCVPDGSTYTVDVIKPHGEKYGVPETWRIEYDSCNKQTGNKWLVVKEAKTNTVVLRDTIKPKILNEYPEDVIRCVSNLNEALANMNDSSFSNKDSELELVDKANGYYRFSEGKTLYKEIKTFRDTMSGPFTDINGTWQEENVTVPIDLSLARNSNHVCPDTIEYTTIPDTTKKERFCIVSQLQSQKKPFSFSFGNKQVYMSGDDYFFLMKSWNTWFGELNYLKLTEKELLNFLDLCYRNGIEATLGIQMSPDLPFDPPHLGFSDQLNLKKFQAYVRVGYRFEVFFGNFSLGLVPEAYAHTNFRSFTEGEDYFGFTQEVVESSHPLSNYTHRNIQVYGGGRGEFGYQDDSLGAIKLFATRYRSLFDNVSRSELGIRIEYLIPL